MNFLCIRSPRTLSVTLHDIMKHTIIFKSYYMKRNLLLVAAGLTVAGMYAESFESPCIIEESTAQVISPNGRYFISAPIEGLQIFDLQTGENWLYINETEENPEASYGFGLGNCISDTGIILGSVDIYYTPYYWQNGEWKALDYGTSLGITLANGITPDGSRICGSSEISADGYSTETRQLPVYWDAEGDGFGSYHRLPCPAVDFTDRAPQMITAISISDDGKTIFGQIVDYSGQYPEPIVYKQDNDGNWSYELPLEKLFRPEGVTLPPYPDEISIPMPTLEEYMTAEELAAYNKAMEDWQKACEESGNWDYSTYPNMEDFISPEGAAAYNAASKKYNEEAMKFNEALEAYYMALESIIANCPLLVLNQGNLVPDGSQAVFTIVERVENDDPFAWVPYTEYTQPCRMNLSDGSMKIYNEYRDIHIWSVLADGSITAGVMGSFMNPVPMEGYIEREGKLVPLFDYINGIKPEYGEWMTENMTHDIETYEEDPDGNVNTVIEEKLVSGAPLASRDLSVIVSWALNIWDFDTPVNYYAYYFKMGEPVGVNTIGSANNEVKSYEVFDVNGVKVLSTADKGAIMELGKGIYLVKAINNDGTVTTTKVAI